MPTVDPRLHLTLERTLNRRLLEALRPLLESYYRAVKARVDAHDWAGAIDAAKHFDASPVAGANREFIRYMLLSFANFGAKRASGDLNRKVSVDASPVVNQTADTMVQAISHDLTLAVINAALQLIAKLQANPVVQKKEPWEYVQDFVSFAQPGNDTLKLISSQNSSRLSTWGFVAEAQTVGVTKYRVTAVLDGRTSKFCRFINGHVFEVKDAARSIDASLSVDDPNDLKTVQPWPSQTKAAMAEYADMSTQDLVDANLHIPPYHPNCRTMLVKVKDDAGNPASDQAEQNSIETGPVDANAFEPFTLTPSDDQLAHWNAVMNANPSDIYAALSGMDLQARYGNGITMKDNGDIQFNIRTDEVKGQYLFNPFTDVWMLTRLDFSGIPPERQDEYLQAVVTGYYEVGAATPAQELGVQPDSPDMIRFWTAQGFLPTRADWQGFKDAVGEQERQSIATALTGNEPDGYAELASLNDPEADQLLADHPLPLYKPAR
jgi:hypothetical protein